MDNGNILEVINISAVKILATQNLEQLCLGIVEEAKKLVNAEYGSIYLKKDNKLERVYVSYRLLTKWNTKRDGLIDRIFNSNAITILHDDKIQKLQPHLKKIGIQSIIFIPLSHRSESIGLLCLHSLKNEFFTSKELHILKLFGSMASLAITKMRSYDETKEALEIRDRFISLASHELRTPLTSLNGYIQLLYSKMANKDSVESRWVEELHTESTRLTNLVKDLLDINRIKQGQLAFFFSEVDMRKLIEKSILQFKKDPDCKIDFIDKVTDEKYIVIGDFERLFEMVCNLLTNAVKFSKIPPMATVILSRSKKKIRVAIKYKGEGVGRKEELKGIFKGLAMDIQANTRDGMGIGLLYARHIIAHHRGKLDVTMTKTRGTTVEVTLPSTRS